MSANTSSRAGTRHPSRGRQSTASWHMSGESVSLAVPEVGKWTDKECLEFLVEVRFGSWNTVRCPHCNSLGKHYWRPLQKRWKCMGCGSTFSITSGTIYSHRKRPLQEIIAGVLMWVNGASGKPALELKRNLDTSYNTAFVWQHKMREGLVRGWNIGFLSGDLEIDGAHQSGRRSKEKRGKPQGSRPITEETPVAELEATALTQQGRTTARKKKKAGGSSDSDSNRNWPKDRRIMFAIRQRSGKRGKGACGTRIAVGLAENATVAESVANAFTAIPESSLNTDTSPAYTEVGRRFLVHRTVEHAKTLIGPNGENNNQAEELNWRQDRAERGIYLNIEPKYLLDYAVETGFRSDTRRIPNGEQLKLALNVAMNVGPSEFWRGFTHGRHRTVELIHPAPQPAASSGPPKGFKALTQRPPR